MTSTWPTCNFSFSSTSLMKEKKKTKIDSLLNSTTLFIVFIFLFLRKHKNQPCVLLPCNSYLYFLCNNLSVRTCKNSLCSCQSLYFHKQTWQLDEGIIMRRTNLLPTSKDSPKWSKFHILVAILAKGEIMPIIPWK